MTTKDTQMPPLPVVAHLNPLLSKTLTDLQLAELKHHAGQPGKTLAADYDEPLCKVSDAQAYAAQLKAEHDAQVAALQVELEAARAREAVLREALTNVSESHPRYEGDWTLDATLSDFGGNADDYAREHALMLYASTGSKARAALSNHTKEQSNG